MDNPGDKMFVIEIKPEIKTVGYCEKEKEDLKCEPNHFHSTDFVVDVKEEAGNVDLICKQEEANNCVSDLTMKSDSNQNVYTTSRKNTSKTFTE